MDAGASCADVGDAIKNLDPSVSTGSEPKIGDAVGDSASPKDIGKAVSEGLKVNSCSQLLCKFLLDATGL